VISLLMTSLTDTLLGSMEKHTIFLEYMVAEDL
jgi:hypothetical protein